MSYIALYREWRPTTFDEVIEQSHVTKTLKNAVKKNRIAHAYLFCGTRGTGKTSMAYIMSRAINCLNPQDGNPCNECEICKGIKNGSNLDVIEMDAASNNGVDNIRNIREEVAYATAQSKYKVYIIDEVHMLSTGAFNALLKTLEEPPKHVVFILATTEPHKLPTTILSRCQRYDFHRISVDGILERLSHILDKKNIDISERALRIIARVANGALRDAISLLDQCISLGVEKIDVDVVLEAAGIIQDEASSDMAEAIYKKDISVVLEILDSVLMQGKSPTQFLSSLIYYYRNLLICESVDDPSIFIEGSDDLIDVMKKQSKQMGKEYLIYVIKELSLAQNAMKKSLQAKIYLEVVLINIASMNISFLETVSLRERISALENKVNRLGEMPFKKEETEFEKVYKPKKEIIQKIEKKEKSKPSQEVKENSNFNWKEIVKNLMNRNIIEVAPFLDNTEAVMTGDLVNIKFSSSFSKDMIEKNNNNIDIIKKEIDENYDSDCTIVLELDEEMKEVEEEFDFSNFQRTTELFGGKFKIEE